MLSSVVVVCSSGSSGAVPRDVGRRLNVRYVLEKDVLHAAADYMEPASSRRGNRRTGMVGALHDADAAGESSADLRNLSGRLRSEVAGAEGSQVERAGAGIALF